MKNVKRVMATVLALSTLVGMAGCKLPGTTTGGGNGNKTIITFATDDSTVGRDWIQASADVYEELHKDSELEPGKKGVEVRIDTTYNKVDRVNATDAHDIITLDSNHINTKIQLDLLADISDLWTRESKYGEGTLEDRVLEHGKFNVMGEDGKYYGVPHNEYMSGLMYNKTIFDRHGLYFTDDEAGYAVSTPYGTGYFVSNDSEEFSETDKSKGPDRKKGTLDDGLPTTLEEFAILCYYMKNDLMIQPISFPGGHPDYVNNLASGLWASLAGYDQLNTYHSFNGKIEVIKGKNSLDPASGLDRLTYTTDPIIQGASKTDARKPETEWVTVDKNNGYYANEMVSRYYALAFVEMCYSEGFFADNSLSAGNQTHIQNQLDFMLSAEVGAATEIGMMCEATYWDYETQWEGNYINYKNTTSKDAKDLDIRFMPLPSALNAEALETSERTDWTNTMVDSAFSALLVLKQVKNDPDHFEAVLDFLDFLYSDTELKRFTKNTGMARPFNYTMEAEDLASMSKFSQNLWELKTTSKIVYHSADNPVFKRFGDSYRIGTWAGTWDCFGTYSIMANLRNKNTATNQFEALRLPATAWESRVTDANWR